MKPPKINTIWTIWIGVMLAYVAMNYFMVSRYADAKSLIGWGIVMPILTNLVWWIIAFRLRFYFPRNWWVFGIATALFVGLAGFITMLLVSQYAPGAV